MAITLNAGRQEVISAYIDVTYDDVPTTATAYEAFNLPVGAEIIAGELVVDTAWNTATTATFDLGDALDDDRYTASAIDLKTAGRTALTLTGYVTLSTSNTLNWLGAYAGTAATAGAARVRIDYIVRGRAAFSQD